MNLQLGFRQSLFEIRQIAWENGISMVFQFYFNGISMVFQGISIVYDISSC